MLKSVKKYSYHENHSVTFVGWWLAKVEVNQLKVWLWRQRSRWMKSKHDFCNYPGLVERSLGGGSSSLWPPHVHTWKHRLTWKTQPLTFPASRILWMHSYWSRNTRRDSNMTNDSNDFASSSSPSVCVRAPLSVYVSVVGLPTNHTCDEMGRHRDQLTILYF